MTKSQKLRLPERLDSLEDIRRTSQTQTTGAKAQAPGFKTKADGSTTDVISTLEQAEIHARREGAETSHSQTGSESSSRVLSEGSSVSSGSASTTSHLASTLSRLSVASTDTLINSPPLGHTESPQTRMPSKLAAVYEDNGPPRILVDEDPYCPYNYICTGYQDEYVWFDGKPGSKDMEFIIDLEGGTMDKLPDVRPFLYHMGYFSYVEDDEVAPHPFPVGTPRTEREDIYVRAGRAYLLAEKKKRNGYFLRRNDWSVYNADPEFETMPYAAFMNYPGEGEEDYVGFDHFHDDSSLDRLSGCLKTNVRVALPDFDLMLVQPGQAGWDDLITTIYSNQYHPVWALKNHFDEAGARWQCYRILLNKKYLTAETKERYSDLLDPYV